MKCLKNTNNSACLVQFPWNAFKNVYKYIYIFHYIFAGYICNGNPHLSTCPRPQRAAPLPSLPSSKRFRCASFSSRARRADEASWSLTCHGIMGGMLILKGIYPIIVYSNIFNILLRMKYLVDEIYSWWYIEHSMRIHSFWDTLYITPFLGESTISVATYSTCCWGWNILLMIYSTYIPNVDLKGNVMSP